MTDRTVRLLLRCRRTTHAHTHSHTFTRFRSLALSLLSSHSLINPHQPQAKASSDRIAEAQAFNALGLIYSEMELDPQGIECMESALELCRAEEDEPGICLTLSNLGVAHVKQECHSLALACFQVVCVSVLARGGVGRVSV